MRAARKSRCCHLGAVRLELKTGSQRAQWSFYCLRILSATTTRCHFEAISLGLQYVRIPGASHRHSSFCIYITIASARNETTTSTTPTNAYVCAKTTSAQHSHAIRSIGLTRWTELLAFNILQITASVRFPPTDYNHRVTTNRRRQACP